MDPLTLTLFALGTYFGVKKVYPWAKEKAATVQQHVHARLNGHAQPQAALPFQLDAALSPAQYAEVANLVTSVRNAAILRTAADLYKSQNLPLAAAALDSRARSLGG